MNDDIINVYKNLAITSSEDLRKLYYRIINDNLVKSADILLNYIPDINVTTPISILCFIDESLVEYHERNSSTESKYNKYLELATQTKLNNSNAERFKFLYSLKGGSPEESFYNCDMLLKNVSLINECHIDSVWINFTNFKEIIIVMVYL